MDENAGLTPIHSFARIKPLEADKGGGTAAEKQLKVWNEGEATIEMDVGGRDKVFDHLNAIIPPEVSQEQVYEVICSPLVKKFVDGFDVDLLCYGQTGSGKTFTMFGPPYSMAKVAEEQMRSGGGTGTSDDGMLLAEHGFLLRAGLEALKELDTLKSRGAKAVLHGSMVEMSIRSFQDQTVRDLQKGWAVCFVDENHHLQGAEQRELRCAADVIKMASSVETRLTRGTRMNDTSSRSHCVAAFKLTVLEEGLVRESRLQFFDLMGSERFAGQNAAHDTRASAKSTEAGWEGIYSNMSLMAVLSCVGEATRRRVSKKGGKATDAMVGMLLTKLMGGSLTGSAVTGMITCLSQSQRNGDETYLSLKYGSDMAKLLNSPKRQTARPADELLARAKRQHQEAKAVVERGVAGKYQALREAQVAQHAHSLGVLEELMGS